MTIHGVSDLSSFCTKSTTWHGHNAGAIHGLLLPFSQQVKLAVAGRSAKWMVQTFECDLASRSLRRAEGHACRARWITNAVAERKFLLWAGVVLACSALALHNTGMKRLIWIAVFNHPPV